MKSVIIQYHSRDSVTAWCEDEPFIHDCFYDYYRLFCESLLKHTRLTSSGSPVSLAKDWTPVISKQAAELCNECVIELSRFNGTRFLYP